MIGISTTPILTLRLASQLLAQPDGKTFTVSLPNGEVLSCQPDGSLQTRPAGANGDYELCTVNGSYLTFYPVDVPFTFGYVPNVPRT